MTVQHDFSKVPTEDPDRVPETLCAGAFNITVTGPLATIVFSHMRKKADRANDPFLPDTVTHVVRARIVLPVEGLIELRNSIDALMTQNPISPGSTARN